MIKKILIPLIIGFFVAFSSSICFASDTSQSVNLVTAVQKLQEQGYSDIREIKYDDGTLKAESVNAEGKKVELRLNPETYQVTKMKTEKMFGSAKANTSKLSLVDAIKAAESAGYHNISKVEFEGKSYEVKALDANGKKVKLDVDANTGAVSKAKWF